jgi:hypothetical protein
VGPELRRLPQEDPGDVSGEQFAWIEERFKYLHHTTGEDELYDLQADPHEKRNLLVDGPSEESQRLADALRIELESLPRRVATPEAVELDAQTRAELRALGYAP